MQRANDYRCPPGCPKRRPACQSSCPRYAKYHELNEERKAAERREQLTVTAAMHDRLNFSNKRFYKI